MAALEVYRTGSDRFPGETSLLTGIARIYEGIGNLSLSAKYYKLVLRVRKENYFYTIQNRSPIHDIKHSTQYFIIVLLYFRKNQLMLRLSLVSV